MSYQYRTLNARFASHYARGVRDGKVEGIAIGVLIGILLSAVAVVGFFAVQTLEPPHTPVKDQTRIEIPKKGQ